jgi:hypothetical protein
VQLKVNSHQQTALTEMTAGGGTLTYSALQMEHLQWKVMNCNSSQHGYPRYSMYKRCSSRYW